MSAPPSESDTDLIIRDRRTSVQFSDHTSSAIRLNTVLLNYPHKHRLDAPLNYNGWVASTVDALTEQLDAALSGAWSATAPAAHAQGYAGTQSLSKQKTRTSVPSMARGKRKDLHSSIIDAFRHQNRVAASRCTLGEHTD